MAYNGRTGNYTGAYPAGYGYQTPYWPQVQQPMMVQQEPNTRTVEVESADSIRAAQETPVGAGQTKMFIGKDDSFILVKAVSMTFFREKPCISAQSGSSLSRGTSEGRSGVTVWPSSSAKR